MANEEHLAILKQGVEVWNQWREQHLQIVPDLRDAVSLCQSRNRYQVCRIYLHLSEQWGVSSRRGNSHVALPSTIYSCSWHLLWQ